MVGIIVIPSGGISRSVGGNVAVGVVIVNAGGGFVLNQGNLIEEACAAVSVVAKLYDDFFHQAKAGIGGKAEASELPIGDAFVEAERDGRHLGAGAVVIGDIHPHFKEGGIGIGLSGALCPAGEREEHGIIALSGDIARIQFLLQLLRNLINHLTDGGGIHLQNVAKGRDSRIHQSNG